MKYRITRKQCRTGVLLLSGLLCWTGNLSAQNVPEKTRTIHLRQDDAQVLFDSKIYELKHASAQEVLPFVQSAILRYHVNSTIRRVTDGTARQALIVSTGREFFPYVDAIIRTLDRGGGPGAGKANTVSGTGLTRIAYAPDYRAAMQFSSIIDKVLSSKVGNAYVNTETNTIFWQDQNAAAQRTLSWLKKLDRPLPQVSIRLNYYELRDSDLKDWGLDYLAWKNGPGVNLLNVGYNAGHLAVDEMLSSAAAAAADFAGSASWGFGGFFTAPQFDMSFVRCLQQSGNASVTANATLTMVNTPVASIDDYVMLLQKQAKNSASASSIYKIAMYPEYQNIAKNTLGRSFVGKSFVEDEYGEKHSNPPVLNASFLNPFICFQIGEKDEDADGFLPSNPEFYARTDELKSSGGVIFDYTLFFKNVVERGNTGAELSNSAVFTGSATLGFGLEKVLAVYEKENDVEQTLGLPILCRIPVIKYLFSTVTTIKERTHIIVTAEAHLIHPNDSRAASTASESLKINRRIENPFKTDAEGAAK